MKLSFASLGCPDWSIEQIVTNAAEMGYDGVELRGAAGEHIGPDEPPAQRERIRTLFAEAGIEIAAIMGYSSFTMDDKAQREVSIRTAAKFCGVAADIACPVLRLFGGKISEPLGREGNVRRVAEALKAVAGVAEEKGVRIALETHDSWTRGEHVRAVIEAVASPALGACWDVANSSLHEPIEDTCEALGGHIAHVHFKDFAEGRGNVLPGTGDVDLLGAVTLLREAGYDDYLSFEWEKKWNPELDDPEVAFPYFLDFCTDLLRRGGISRG